MCVAVRLAAGWWTTAVARVEQREGERGKERQKERERERSTDRSRARERRSARRRECVREREREREREMERRRHASTQTGSPPSQKQQEQHSNPHLLFLFILQSLSFLCSPPPCRCCRQLRCSLCPLPLSFSGNVNVLLTHSSQLLSQPQSSALV